MVARDGRPSRAERDNPDGGPSKAQYRRGSSASIITAGVARAWESRIDHGSHGGHARYRRTPRARVGAQIRRRRSANPTSTRRDPELADHVAKSGQVRATTVPHDELWATRSCRFGRSGATGRALAARSPGSVLHVPRCDLGLGRTSGLRRWLDIRGADKGTGSNFLAMGKPPAQRGLLGPGQAGWERSSDRLLTVGVDAAGRHAAPRAGLGWQARRGRELPLAGHGTRTGCCSRCRRDGLRGRRAAGRGKTQISACCRSAGSACRAVNPGKCAW